MIASQGGAECKQSCRWLLQSSSHIVANQKHQNQIYRLHIKEERKLTAYDSAGKRADARKPIAPTRANKVECKPRLNHDVRREHTSVEVL
jgi:hypothetical protein